MSNSFFYRSTLTVTDIDEQICKFCTYLNQHAREESINKLALESENCIQISHNYSILNMSDLPNDLQQKVCW